MEELVSKGECGLDPGILHEAKSFRPYDLDVRPALPMGHPVSTVHPGG